MWFVVILDRLVIGVFLIVFLDFLGGLYYNDLLKKDMDVLDWEIVVEDKVLYVDSFFIVV